MPEKHTLFLLLSFLLHPFVALFSQEKVQHTVYFETGSASLSYNSRYAIKAFIDSLGRTELKYEIIVTGHTDNRGSSESNKKLSKQRAVAVNDFLLESGFTGINVLIDYKGEIDPVAPNNTEAGRKLNRRADIIALLHSNDNTGEKNIPDGDNIPAEGNIAELYELLKSPAQEFCIDLSRDTFLIGNKGTIIQYKANTIKPDGLPCKCFTLKLNEYYDKPDLILNNLTTTSEGNPLESGGMIKLEGYCDGILYKLKPGEYFTVMLPTDTVVPEMKLLSANRDSIQDYLNWQLDPDYPAIDTFDFDRMLLFCKYKPVKVNCPFFFCRIGNFFRKIFSPKKYYTRNDRKNNELIKVEENLVNKYELNGESLAIALQKSRDRAGTDALKYYVYKNASWDYRNIDRYKRGNYVNFLVKNTPDGGTDIKIVFKMTKTVVPAFEKKKGYLFEKIIDKEEAWLVGLRYTADRQILIGLKEINTSEGTAILEFRPVTLDELKAEMARIKR